MIKIELDKDQILRLCLLVAFILSLVGAILLLATPFAGWSYYSSYQYMQTNYATGSTYYYFNTSSDAGVITLVTMPYGLIVLMIALFLIFSAAIALVAFQFPDKLPDTEWVRYASYLSLIALILATIGGIAFAAVMAGTDNYWWFEAGFYGGMISSLVSALLLYYYYLQSE